MQMGGLETLRQFALSRGHSGAMWNATIVWGNSLKGIYDSDPAPAGLNPPLTDATYARYHESLATQSWDVLMIEPFHWSGSGESETAYLNEDIEYGSRFYALALVNCHRAGFRHS